MWRRIFSRSSGAATLDGPSHTLFAWLVGAFLLTLVPHALVLPGWLTAAILLALAVRCVAEWKHWPLPTSTSTGVVALCLVAGIYLQYHTLFGKDAGTPLMAGLLAIKFYELRGPRDITLIVFSSFFVVMSALLFSQAIELFVYCLIMMWLLTGILLRTNQGDHSDQTLLRMLRASSLIFVQALPLALLLFFFLPRYAGKLSLQFSDAITGLSDHVNPGDIASLANSDLPAMRVTFIGNTQPMTESMYWRAIVLWHFDGRTWSRGQSGGHLPPLADTPSGKLPHPQTNDVIVQNIVLWPNGQRWLPALDRPIDLAKDINGNPISEMLLGGVLVMAERELVNSKRPYQVRSTPLLGTERLGDEERGAATQLDRSRIDPRVQRLADQLFTAGGGTTSGYIHAVLRYFRSGGFSLTTTPGRLSHADPVADFLFRTKRGFCEHYASAFGELMRIEHVPVRMIVGYRGGEFDPYGANGGFYLVNQSNAHAWDEVYLDDRHEWQRVDPTAIIMTGTSRAIAASQGLPPDDDLDLRLADRRITLLPASDLPSWVRRGLRDLQMRREEIEAQWDDWVFSYDPTTQDNMMRALGLGTWSKATLFSGCLLVVGLASVLAMVLLTRRRRLPPVERFYVRFCRCMAQRGAPREPWEGPSAYADRLAERFPMRREPLEEAGQIVAQFRYGEQPQTPPSTRLAALLSAVSGKE